MKRLDEKTICEIRQIYPKGTRLKLQRTDNPQAPPIGTRGTEGTKTEDDFCSNGEPKEEEE